MKPRYRVATPSNGGMTQADRKDFPEFNSIEKVGDALRPHEFDRCTVWKYDGRARHWRIIFDTSLPENRQIASSQYWLNVAQNEKGQS